MTAMMFPSHPLINDIFRDFDAARRQVEAAPRWTPAVDIRVEADRFVLLADLPGVEPGDIELTLEDGVLTLRGHRAGVAEDASHTRIERRTGEFERRFQLPEDIDPERIEAQSRHGVLEVVLHKQERSLPRRITINA